MLKKVLMGVLLVLLLAVLGIVVYARLYAQVIPEPSPSPSPVVEATPSPTPTPTPTPTPEPYADKPDIDISSWEYTLVNTENPLTKDFSPDITAVANSQYFDSRAADALNEFIAGAKAQGLTVYITSAYRNYNTQEYLFNRKVSQYVASEGSEAAAIEKAKTIVAYPGTSEHQLGLACDIVDKYYQYMNETIADTPLSQWLAAHCTEYGFILRYPRDKTDITGVMYEPWHFRYVGKEAAVYITNNGLTLEEFVALYK